MYNDEDVSFHLISLVVLVVAFFLSVEFSRR